MVSLQKAWDILRNIKLLTKPETIPIYKSNKRIAYRDVRANHDSPPFAQSRFDGYALGETDEKTSIFKIVSNSPITAGNEIPHSLSRGEAISIMTGAPLPKGAQKIAPSEVCHVKNQYLRIDKYPEQESMVLEKGADFSKGQIFLKGGEAINPIHVAFMALDGKKTVDVFSLPSISVVSSGDELKTYREKHLKRGQIRNSHPVLIQALLSPYGIVDQKIHVPDNIEVFEKTLKNVLHSDSHVTITTGGMGKGIKDLTQRALHEIGAIPLFEGIDAVPIGTFSCYQYRGKVVFSLPGGMVGVILLTRLFIYPFIKKIQGWAPSVFVGPFHMAKPKEALRSSFKTKETGVGFAKARLWDESGEKWVAPLDARLDSLTMMNAFIVMGYDKKGRDKKAKKVPVFPLWNE